MSYILDALKKSDQQRQRGATPTLQAVQTTMAAPKRPSSIHYGLLAAVLLGAGILIGWLRPWQVEQPPSEAEPIASKLPVSIPQQTAPALLPAAPEIARRAAQEFPVPDPVPAVQSVPKADAAKPDDALAPVSAAVPSAAAPMQETHRTEKPASPAAVEQERRVMPMAELPPQIRQEIPAMAVQLHAYSSNPAERLVNIDFRRLREGAYVTPGLRLEQITPDGMIFNYKGYRFERGIR